MGGINVEIIGWIGSVLFAFCGLPQAVACYRAGHSRGLAWGFLLAWFFGEILTIVYVFPKQDIPLLFNYGFNFLILLVIMRYKIWERAQ